ncbi:hypothetical protein JI743_14890 [Sphingopyxis sp. DHUNG17]|uniref:hypothetical protein n=1 Tax=Sphingopyxis jiangsuensis TaxID=2871171 RepID=UPI00191E23D8|nr:hypothetical protein [Sphingopyxis lutea]MBL0770094.1 hypothetical protein [Sphingopyxis lutea]
MRIAIFASLLLIALIYAVWKGGGPERAMVGIAVTIVIWDRILVGFGLVSYHSLDIGYLLLDVFGAAATLALALVAYRFWPIPVAILHALPLLAHLSRAADLSISPKVYLTMQVGSSWLLPPLLILATWHHQRRLKRFGSDPSWHVSWRSLPPDAASTSPTRS